VTGREDAVVGVARGDTGAGDPGDVITQDAIRRGVTGLLDVEVVEAGPERVVLRLAVDDRVHQPYGILHGGVSALLAETAASFGGALAAPGRTVAGIELNASHLRAMRSGELITTATPLRIGRTVHVWDVVLEDGEGRMICKARCTLAVLGPTPRPESGTTMGAPGTGEK
jgi:1,4-dihydroxy-2-naphthoyl-CoA hydrolase